MAKLVGYAAVFNSLSEDLGDFREIIAPQAFDRALSERHDAFALHQHEWDQKLGRVSDRTLALTVDAQGLRSDIHLDGSPLATEVQARVESGVSEKMSFAFVALDDDWTVKNEQIIREVRDLVLLDVSIVEIPAYRATSVASVRSIGYMAQPTIVRSHNGGLMPISRSKYATQAQMAMYVDRRAIESTAGVRRAPEVLAAGMRELARKGRDLVERRYLAVRRGEHPAPLTRDEAVLVDLAHRVEAR
jgi:HK97 family phage prohead protease